ncbi:anthranilate synthase component I family protein [Halococcoides cellulosivorans]|uniref:anthranilate synthase n=1 Tax=Halococcoides cellulosivorans TaxID=1679096 RepID=A0A2R4WZA5_9EURY|nr:anthranilate synthase component I family protein [Halococcoides cellulosivorans]AWB26871.1 anthranilate synthase component I [Halococcoides cellulosivorans]
MTGVAVRTERDAFCRLAADASAGARIPVVGTVSVADPFRAYRRTRTAADTGVYLETGQTDGWGYFGVDPSERIQIDAPAAVRAVDDAATDRTGRPSAGDSPTLWALDGLLEGETLVRGDCEIPYPCGWVGWLSYDIARELEALPGETDDLRALPRAVLHRYDGWAAWKSGDGEHTTLSLTACPQVGDDPDAAYDRAVDRIEGLATAATTGPLADPEPPVAGPLDVESACGRDAYCDRVAEIQRAIRAGETFQANVAHRLTGPAAVHPIRAFAALRELNPAPYSALFEDRTADLVSASPELLLDVTPESGGDRLTTEPIAGTRPRGATDPVDRAAEYDLRHDAKERAEHAMLVDLERNDLGAVSQFGSVEPSEYRRVDRYDAVMHLVSIIEGRARPEVSVPDAIAATFPGGTITGAPKPRTMELIDAVERDRRGPYTGSIGLFGFDGRATCNIVIRTLVRQDDRYECRVGAGIVADSDPDREYDETLAKGQALVDALAMARDRRDCDENDTTEGNA